MTAYFFTLSTPDGPFSVITDGSLAKDGAVLASGWTADAEDLLPQIHKSLRPEELTTSTPDPQVKKAVAAYYDGDLQAIDRIPVRQKSGPFREHAWDVLRTVTAGSPVSYTEYAELSGNPQAVRAAASACAFNAAALFVPCHRVLRNDGTLGGFRWGVELKERLLARERTVAQG